jgi:hypothetical protein
MNLQTQSALQHLGELGFRGRDVYFSEMIPIVEMAWADGAIQPNELALLEAYCETLTNELNALAGARIFSLRRALMCLRRLTVRRLNPWQRQDALQSIEFWSSCLRHGAAMRHRILEWSEAVGAIDGSPVWDTRELFWWQTLKQSLEPKT